MKKSFIYIIVFFIILILSLVLLLKNKNSEIVQIPVAPQIVDEEINDEIIVEKYIRDNVKNIVLEEPVLGGSWYITLIDINPSTKTGTMTYEDGHIQGESSFKYTRNGEEIIINLVESIE